MNENPKKRKRKNSYPERYSAVSMASLFMPTELGSQAKARLQQGLKQEHQQDSPGHEWAQRNRCVERRSYSTEVSRKIEDNGILSDHCYSICSLSDATVEISQSEDKLSSCDESRELQDNAGQEPVCLDREVMCTNEKEDTDNASPKKEDASSETQDSEQTETSDSCFEMSDIKDNLSITNQQRWPLLRVNSSGLFKCEQCDFNSKYFSDLKGHIILKHKCPINYSCKVCGQEFLSHSLLSEHLKVHKQDRFVCSYCDHRTSELEDLNLHVAEVHFNDFLYWCEQCDLQFCTISELYLHLQQHDSGEQYLCQFCEHETSDPEDLHSHTLNEHADRLIKISDNIRKNEQGQLQLFTRIHFDEQKNFFVCQLCGYKSRLHSNVNRHVAIEHTRFYPYVCDECGKGFSSMLEYSNHLKLYHSREIFLCQYCEYSTGQTEDLRIHLDFRHAIDLPHKCRKCLLRFVAKEDLRNHLLSHGET